jgi:hypothetical protein
MMTVRPMALNAAIAWLFIVGSALFVLGSVPAYVHAVGATVDGITYFVGSIFFTAASFTNSYQPRRRQRPTSTRIPSTRGRRRGSGPGWPHDRNWLAAITQFPGTREVKRRPS